MSVVGRVLELGPRPLHEFREAIRDDAAANAKSYESFRDQSLSVRCGEAGLLDDTGYGVSWAVRLIMAGAVLGSFFLLPKLLSERPRWRCDHGADLRRPPGGARSSLFILLSFRRVRNRRSKEGALESARWEAFRRYLSDFSRLEGGPADLARALGPLPGVRHRVRGRRRGPATGQAPRPAGAGDRHRRSIGSAPTATREATARTRLPDLNRRSPAPLRHRPRAVVVAGSPAAVAEVAVAAAVVAAGPGSRDRRANGSSGLACSQG